MRGLEVAMAANSWQAIHRATLVNLQKGDGDSTMVEVELLGEFGKELEGEDGVSGIDEDEILDGDGISGIGKDE
ncbi:hypothetical protein TorRG33x02_105790, partial [Trema orientale]